MKIPDLVFARSMNDAAIYRGPIMRKEGLLRAVYPSIVGARNDFTIRLLKSRKSR